MIKKEPGINSCNPPGEIAISKIQSYIDTIEEKSSLHEEKNVEQRMEAIDFIGFHVIDQIKGFLQQTGDAAQLIALKHRAEKVKAKLEAIDTNLFQKLRVNIQTGRYTGKAFKNLVCEYIDFNLADKEHQEEAGYDNLDIFVNGLFPFQAMPEQTKELEAEMVFYQKTPARVIFELVEKAGFTNEDVFFDLGSGLGQAVILINLLSGITACGVEFEPAFYNYASACATQFKLPEVKFINADARNTDYTNGTVFFMYTPFEGKMLDEVLAILKKESQLRKIRVFTYGPCTTQVALQSWLDFEGRKDGNIYKLGVFSSM